MVLHAKAAVTFCLDRSDFKGRENEIQVAMTRVFLSRGYRQAFFGSLVCTDRLQANVPKSRAGGTDRR